MNKTDKETLYNLLNISQSYLTGFKDDSIQIPNFTDDIKVSLQTENLNDNQNFQENNKPVSTGITLEILNEKIQKCDRCGLCRTRKQTVPGVGVSRPLVMVIGEGPGADEDAQGLPFVGKAGQLLDKMLIAINLSRNTNCYIANIVKCRPPANRDPLLDECNACMPYLETQIHILKPAMILAVGRVAAHNLFKTSDPVNKMRGKIYDVHGIPAMMTYHPSALLRDETLKRPAWEDLKLFRTKLDSRLRDLALEKK
jgi:DNA polymerase